MLLYHWYPPHLIGTMLYPLSQLEQVLPDVYEKALQRYAGREQVPNQQIPLFDCLWRDVIFLSPIAPPTIKAARLKLGLKVHPGDWLAIDSSMLDQDRLVVYWHRPAWLIAQNPKEDEYTMFSHLTSEQKKALVELPGCAIWSMEKFREKSFFFSYMPHVMYRGKINSLDARVIQN